MQLAQIRHQAHFLDCYPLNEKELKISIRTGKDVTEVFLYAGDPYSVGMSENEEKWRGKQIPMAVERELPFELTWSAVIRPEYRRIKYHFEIVSGGEHIYLLEDGFYGDVSNLSKERMIQRFIYPWMNPADVVQISSGTRFSRSASAAAAGVRSVCATGSGSAAGTAAGRISTAGT